MKVCESLQAYTGLQPFLFKSCDEIWYGHYATAVQLKIIHFTFQQSVILTADEQTYEVGLTPATLTIGSYIDVR